VSKGSFFRVESSDIKLQSSYCFQYMDETAFRTGATRAASWLADVAKRMADGGKSAQEIAQRLSDLSNVLGDWRTNGITQAIELPEGESNPWEWSEERLDASIAHRKNWIG